MNSTSSSSLHTLEVVSSALLEELDQERRKQEEAEGQNSPPLLLLLPSQLDFFSSLTSFYSSLQDVKNKEEASKPNEVERGGGEEERDNQEGAFTVQQYCTCLMPAFKCLRLACAGNCDNAVLLTKIGAPQIVGESISACFCAYQEEREASSRDISSDDKSLNRDENSHKSNSSSHENGGDISSESLFKSLFTVAMQFFANYSSCKSLDNSVLVSFPNTLWSENGIGGVEGFSKYINMAVVLKARNGLTAIFAALYNCFLAEVDGTLTSFKSSRQLCCQLALSVMDMQYAECASSKSMDIRTSLPIHPNVEWFQILVLYLVKKDCFVAVLQQVKRNQVGQLDAKACFSLAMSHEEIIYISALQSILEDRVSVQHVPTECMQHIVWYLSQLILDNSDGLAGGIYPSAKTFDEESVAMDVKFAEFLSALQPKEEKFTGDKLRAVDHRVLSMPSTTCCMSIFSDLAAICNSTDAPFKEDLLKSGVMNICSAFLAGILEIKKGNMYRSNAKFHYLSHCLLFRRKGEEICSGVQNRRNGL